MGNTMQFFEVARLHQREVERELASRLLIKGSKSANSTERGLKKLHNILSVYFLKKMAIQKRQEMDSPKKHLVLNTNS
jgi:hypothetical protein